MATPLNTIWTPLKPNLTKVTWCDGSAYYYPTEQPDKCRPILLSAYNQIIKVHNASTSNSVAAKDLWLASKPWTKAEVKDFKTRIDEYQQSPGWSWEIPIGAEDYFHKNDVNELRRRATYPETEYLYPLAPMHFASEYIRATSKGMRIYAEYHGHSDSAAGRWEKYVGSKIAPPNQSHRFWTWSVYVEYSQWMHATAGIIDLDGTMLPPIAGCHEGSNYEATWTSSPNYTHTYRHESYWHLAQLVQDIHKPVSSLSTAKKNLKGTQHFTFSSYQGQPTGGGTENIETGNDFFHTWEYYMDHAVGMRGNTRRITQWGSGFWDQ